MLLQRCTRVGVNRNHSAMTDRVTHRGEIERRAPVPRAGLDDQVWQSLADYFLIDPQVSRILQGLYAEELRPEDGGLDSPVVEPGKLLGDESRDSRTQEQTLP